MRVIWTTQAQKDRHAIWEYIAVNNPVATGEMDVRFSEAASLLTDHPWMGREGWCLVRGNCFPMNIIGWSMKFIRRLSGCLH